MDHQTQVKNLQKQVQNHRGPALMALKRHKGHSNTTRSKAYHHSSHYLTSDPLDQIVHIDTKNRIVRVQPQVTMVSLINALLPYGLTIPIVPEFKGITVGGAIMGAAAESKSFQWGIFSDQCTRFELILGDGSLINASPTENADLFYALPGSYGTFGLLVSTDLKLIEAPPYIHIKIAHYDNTDALISSLRALPSEVEFVDGVLFAKNHGVIVTGYFSNKILSQKYSCEKPLSPWFYQKIKSETTFTMTFFDYLFRFDRGAFWMGGYLLKPSLLAKFFLQGIFKIVSFDHFTQKEIQKYHRLDPPTFIQRVFSNPQMPSQKLWQLLHKAEKWVQDRFIIQDCCIPEANVSQFLQEVNDEINVFPLWVCPIKGTKNPQIFAPHLLSSRASEENFINVGIYGLPSTHTSIENLTKKLELKTKKNFGRKVLYSRSYYTEKEFWEIYPRDTYEILRQKTAAQGKWPDIVSKVLSS